MVDDKIKGTVNRIASQIPLASKQDLSVLADILKEFESLQEMPGLPGAFYNVINRSENLINNIILNEADFEKGLVKLNKGVEKLNSELDRMDAETSLEMSQEQDASGIEENNEIQDDSSGIRESEVQRGTVENDKKPNNEEEKKSYPIEESYKELFDKFVESQPGILEDFEAYIIELDKGIEEATDSIKGIIHTWKGEFGVLEMSSYASLMHHIETCFADGSITSDKLFKLKDLIEEKIEEFKKGYWTPVTNSEKEYVLGSADENGEELDVDEEENTKQEVEPEISKGGEEDQENQDNGSVRKISADQGMISEFITESREHIEVSETLLLELEKDPEHMENLNAVFRACHTIKGIAGFLELKDVQELSHKIESVMDLSRKDKIKLNENVIDLLMNGIDALKQTIENIESGMEAGGYSLPIGYSELLNKLVYIVENEDTKSHKIKLGEILVNEGKVAEDDMIKARSAQRKGDSRKIGEILVESKQASNNDVEEALNKQKEKDSQGTKSSKSKVQDTIRVPVEKLDKLIDSVGEAVIAHSMISDHPEVTSIENHDLERKFSQSKVLMDQIQELSMSLRMVTVKSTFQKMSRVSRDLSKKINKKIEFVTEGEDTELDKSVVENLSDPLIHMVRNSVDHGIESSEERKKTGKPEKGKIILRAFHQSGSIHIEIEDDGKGLDTGKIVEKAKERGIIKSTDNLNEEEIKQLIFQPGFSTAKEVTDVSGRGVGMDVVKKNIEALRGSVKVKSKQGEGSVFSIQLPLTLAIIDGMIVKSCGERYILPTLSVIRNVKYEDDKIKTVMGKGRVIEEDGEFIRCKKLCSMLYNEDNETLNESKDRVVMFVEDILGKRLAIEVDEIVGKQQVVIKKLGKQMKNIPALAGGAIMSDGNVALIVDISGLIKNIEE